MAKNRMTRKQLLKQPDEFLTLTAKMINWAKANAKSLIIGAATFLGIVVLISIYSFFQDRRSNTAEEMLGTAISKYQTEIETKDPQAALTAVRDDFEALINSYSGLPAGQMGTLMFGHVCLAGKAYDDAIAHYQKALSFFGSESSLINVILNGLGTAYQQKGEYNLAVEQYQKVAAAASPVLKDTALFNLGRLYGQLGKSEEQKKAFNQLETDFPDSMYVNMVKEMVAAL